jgi:hypothetical protein
MSLGTNLSFCLLTKNILINFCYTILESLGREKCYFFEWKVSFSKFYYCLKNCAGYFGVTYFLLRIKTKLIVYFSSRITLNV